MEVVLENRSKIFYGWWNVSVAFVGLSLSYAMFTVFSFGSFVVALESEFGWSRQELALGLTVTNITVVVMSPLLGGIVDKLGVRRVLLSSIILMGLAVGAMAFIGPHIWQFYLIYFLIPLLGAGTLPLTYSRVMISWFSRRRGLALGIALSGFGVGAALIPLLSQWLITGYGWRNAYLVFALMILVINLPLTWLLLREKPQSGELNDEFAAESCPDPAHSISSQGLSFKQARQTKDFWLVLSSFLLVGIGITSILAHLVPILLGRGVDPVTAAWCMSSLGLGLIVGRISSGLLMDRFFAPWVTAFFLSGLCLGIVILASGASGSLVFVAAVLVGLATGSEISEIAYIISRYFGSKSFGLIYGVMFAAFQLGSAFGAPALAAYYDRYGNYDNALYAIAGLVAVGTILMLFLNPYPQSENTQPKNKQGQ
jgi:MFS family permease